VDKKQKVGTIKERRRMPERHTCTERWKVNMANSQIKEFETYLYKREKQPRTIEKYIRDIRQFDKYRGEAPIDRELVLKYKAYLVEHYKVTSANSMLVALNGYLKFLGYGDLCVNLCRVQRQIFREAERDLTQEEYRRLVLQAEKNGNQRLFCILQTLGSTGIRVGELQYIRVESLNTKIVDIRLKGKTRSIILPNSLIMLLKDYCHSQNIQTGSIFVTRSGQPMDRRNIWEEMKRLCGDARVSKEKVFPHNLRHLFARVFYEREKDIVRLADYLGHSSVETTRRYTMISTMEACQRKLELGMLVGTCRMFRTPIKI